MPRIPSGNFNTVQSKDVGRDNFRRVNIGETVGSNLKKAGNQMVGAANQLEQAQQKVASMEKVDTAELNVMQFNIGMQGKQRESVNGYVMNDNNDKVLFTEYRAGKEKELSAKNDLIIGEDAQAREIYSPTSKKVAMDNFRAAEWQAKEHVKHTNKKLDSEQKDMRSMYIAGGDISAQMLSNSRKIQASVGIISETEGKERIAESYRDIARAGSKSIMNNKYSKQREDVARANLKYLPKGERLLEEKKLDSAVSHVLNHEYKALNTSAVALSKKINTHKGYTDNKDEVTAMLDGLLNSTIVEGADVTARVTATADLTAQTIVSSMSGDNLGLTDEQSFKYADKFIGTIFGTKRGIASVDKSTLGKQVGNKTIMAAIRKSAYEKIAARNLRKKQFGGSTDVYAENNPEYELNMQSKDPVKTSKAIEGMLSSARNANIANEKVSLVSTSQAKEYVSTINGVKDGADPHGDVRYSVFEDIAKTFGPEYSTKAVFDAITRGKGTVPSSMAMLGMMSPSDGRDLMMVTNKMKKNLDVVTAETQITSADFTKRVEKEISSKDYGKLVANRGNVGLHLYGGVRESITAYAAADYAQSVASGGFGYSVSSAISNAINKFEENTLIGTSGGNSILLGRKFMDKYPDVDSSDMGDTIESIAELDGVEGKVDYGALKDLANKNRFLARGLAVINKGIDGDSSISKKQLFLDVFEGIIHVSNSADNPDTARIFLKSPTGSLIPLPMDNGDETSGFFDVDIDKYYTNKRTTARSTSRKSGDNLKRVLDTLAFPNVAQAESGSDSDNIFDNIASGYKSIKKSASNYVDKKTGK